MRFAYHFSPSDAPLRFVTNHSRVTRVSLACHSRFAHASVRTTKQYKNANIDCRSPFPRCRAKRERKFLPPGDKQKTKAIAILHSLTKTKYSSNNATVATFSQTLISVIGYIRTQDRVLLPILDCCLVPLKKYSTFGL